MEGKKFSKDKLPLFTTLFKQFPLAIEEVTRCTAAGHKKYEKFGDEDWQNFSRVPDAKNAYLNAAMRHLKDSETMVFNEDMKEYDPKVRHLANFAWNALAALEIEMREEKVGINKASLENTECVESKEAIQNSINQGDVLPSGWLTKVEELRKAEIKKLADKFFDPIYGTDPIGHKREIYYDEDGDANFRWVPDTQISKAKDEAEQESIPKWLIANGENTPYESWLNFSNKSTSFKESKALDNAFNKTYSTSPTRLYEFDRPTLSVDQLLDRKDYNDFPQEDSV